MSETAISILNKFANEQYDTNNDTQFISYVKNIIRPLVGDLLDERDELLQKKEELIKDNIQLSRKLNEVAKLKKCFIEIYNDEEGENDDI